MEFWKRRGSLLGEEDPLYIVGERIHPLPHFQPVHCGTTATWCGTTARTVVTRGWTTARGNMRQNRRSGITTSAYGDGEHSNFKKIPTHTQDHGDA